MTEGDRRFKGIARGGRDVPPTLLEDLGDVVERLSVRRDLDSPEEAIVFSLFATTAALANLCGHYLERFPVFERLGVLTRIEALHFLFILYDFTKEEEERGESLRVTQKLIGMIMTVLGRGNQTSIPNALKNAFHAYLEGGVASRRLKLNESGLRLAEEIASQYYPLMEELFESTRSEEVQVMSRALRRLRDNAGALDQRLGGTESASTTDG